MAVRLSVCLSAVSREQEIEALAPSTTPPNRVSVAPQFFAHPRAFSSLLCFVSQLSRRYARESVVSASMLRYLALSVASVLALRVFIAHFLEGGDRGRFFVFYRLCSWSTFIDGCMPVSSCWRRRHRRRCCTGNNTQLGHSTTARGRKLQVFSPDLIVNAPSSSYIYPVFIAARGTFFFFLPPP